MVAKARKIKLEHATVQNEVINYKLTHYNNLHIKKYVLLSGSA